LAGENQAVPQIVGLEDVARRQVDFTLDYGRHARTAAAFAARIGHINARIEQHIDQGLTARPAKTMPSAVQVDLYVCDF
jgi:hypothetical protein